ncbi:MAG: START-like domain-containing protein [Bacteroidales bacterium]
MKTKFELEYSFSCSISILYNRLSTPGGLAEWFAEDVNQKGKIFIFIWDNTEQQAEVLGKKENKFIRFRWIDDEEAEEGADYFEFKINQDELTNDLALVITDFAEEDEKNDAIDLWDTQIAELKHTIGL